MPSFRLPSPRARNTLPAAGGSSNLPTYLPAYLLPHAACTLPPWVPAILIFLTSGSIRAFRTLLTTTVPPLYNAHYHGFPPCLPAFALPALPTLYTWTPLVTPCPLPHVCLYLPWVALYACSLYTPSTAWFTPHTCWVYTLPVYAPYHACLFPALACVAMLCLYLQHLLFTTFPCLDLVFPFTCSLVAALLVPLPATTLPLPVPYRFTRIP